MREPEIKLFGRKIQLPDIAGDATGDESSGGFADQGQSIQADEVQFPGEVASETKDRKSPSRTEESLEQENVASPEQQKAALKKPDKILPCPRCASMDTKFCYYNNYNVNQPRHFCKSCQRYWTAGGTMRNVPIGSGRRKNNKSSSTAINEEALHQPPYSDGTVLSFGPNSQSFPEERTVEKGHHHYSKAGRGGSISCENGVRNGFSWAFPWNPYYPIPAFYPQAPYWVPNSWNNPPWISATTQLGKHSRNGELLKPEGEEKKILEASIVVPKILRIDDPEEAAKSSIWETLGIRYDSVQREGLFKALQPKLGEENSIAASNSSVLLQANPAALSRSVTFQERAA